MKKLFILASLLILASCTELPSTGEKLTTGDVTFEVTKIGECEYIIGRFGDHYLFSHKGDCKNPIHAPIAMYENIPFDTIPAPDGDTTYIGK